MDKKALCGIALAMGCCSASSMDCGSGVALCGVLVLESGYGTGYYEHPEPVVHGLWPEVDGYGTSECIQPGDTSDPTVVYECYEQKGETEDECLSFEVHEWDAHGLCSGAADSDDYLTQICDLAEAPLAIMNATRYGGGDTDLDDMAEALASAGYEVFSVDSSDSQIELSACAGPDTRWKLAAVSDFPSVCGGWSDDNTAEDDSTQCSPNTHGPPCSSDDDCVSVPSCVRCASSGYCTDEPLAHLLNFTHS